MSFRTPLIFPGYGEDSVGVNGLIFHDTFKTSNNVGGGTLVGDDTSVAVFDKNGYHPNGSSALKLLPAQIPGLATMLQTGFTLGFKLSKHFFSNDYIGDTARYVVRFNHVTGSSYFIKNSGSARLRQNFGNNVNIATDDEDKDDMVQMHITGANGQFLVYIDYIPAAEGAITNLTDLQDISFGGLGTVGIPSMDLDSVSDVFIYGRPMMLMPSSYILGGIDYYGDSMANQAQYQNAITGYFAILAEQPDGQNQAGFFNGTQSKQDTTDVQVLHRLLQKNGLGINNNRISCWGEGGSGVITRSGSVLAGKLSDRTDVSTNGQYRIPNHDIFSIGTNDCATMSISDTNLKPGGQWQTDFQSVITKRLNAGVKHIHLLSIQGRTDSGYLGNFPDLSRITYANDSIDALVSANAGKVHKVDSFAEMGGVNIDPSYLIDGLHMTRKGMVLRARLIHKSIINTL